MASERQYAWAAGFFDGEGCVSLHTAKKDQFTCLRIILVQKDIRPLEYFRDVFQRDEKINHVYRHNRRHVYFRLVISGQRAAGVLRCMLPYLVLKRDVAEVALEFQSSVDEHRLKYGKVGMPPSVKQERQAFVEQVKWLNSGRWAAAETKPSDPLSEGCDSPNRRDGKPAEVAETTTRPS